VITANRLLTAHSARASAHVSTTHAQGRHCTGQIELKIGHAWPLLVASSILSGKTTTKPQHSDEVSHRIASHFATLCGVSVGNAQSSRSRQHSLLAPNVSPPCSFSTPPRACPLTPHRARVRSPSTCSSAATPSTRRRLRQTAAGHDAAVVCIDDKGKAAAAGTTISGNVEPVVFIGWGGKVVVADLDVLPCLARGGKVVLVDEHSVVCTADGGQVVVDLGLVVRVGVAGRVCLKAGQRRRRARRRQEGRPGARAGALNRRCGRPRRRRRPLRGRRRRCGCGCSAAVGNDAHVGNCAAVDYSVVEATAWLSALARR